MRKIANREANAAWRGRMLAIAQQLDEIADGIDRGIYDPAVAPLIAAPIRGN
jgi:hypothetical protein